MSSYWVNVRHVRQSLDEVQNDFDAINSTLAMRRDLFTDQVKDRMVLAYTYLNELVRDVPDPFSPTGLQAMLELNTRVHCGVDPRLRAEYRGFLVETRERFYDRMDPIISWNNRHSQEGVYKRAAETYVGILSNPQVFIEGNHRTGALIASWLLLADDKPPFVLTTQNARAYFDPSTQIKFTDKRSIKGKLKLPKYKKGFSRFLHAQTDYRFMYLPG